MKTTAVRNPHARIVHVLQPLCASHDIPPTESSRIGVAFAGGMMELSAIRETVDRWVPWDTFLNVCCWGLTAVIGGALLYFLK